MIRKAMRFDRGELLKAPIYTPEGYLLCEGVVAKPGILEYRTDDGRTIRELVPLSTLQDPEYLASIANKPVTLEHPDELVTPDNVATYGVGTVGKDIKVLDNGYVTVTLNVQRKDALQAISNGKQELSPGYSVTIDDTPGEDPVYGRYDTIQVKRTGNNHVAICDQARGGREVRLRADSAIQITPTQKGGFMFLLLASLATALGKPFTQLRKDSTDAEMGAVGAEMVAGINDLKGSLDKAMAEKAALAKQLADKDAEVKALEAKLKGGDPAKALDQMMEGGMEGPEVEPVVMVVDMKKMDSILPSLSAVMDERSRVVSAAQTHLKMDSAEAMKKGNGELRKAVVLKMVPGARKDGTPDYYRAAFDLLPAASTVRTDSADTDDATNGGYPSLARMPIVTRQDSKDPDITPPLF